MRFAIASPGVRGPATYTLNLYKYLAKAGHQVLLTSEARWKKEEIPVCQASSVLLFGLAPMVYTPQELISAIRDFRPDIIHYHWPCGTMDLLFGWILDLHVPTAVTIHVAADSRKFLWDQFFYLHFGMFKRHLRRVGAVVSISAFVEKQVVRRVGLSEDRSRLIYAGVDSELFRPLPKERGDLLNVLFVGQIMPEKGIDALMDAVVSANRKRPVHLKIVGEGHLKKMLQHQTRGLDFIEWAGFIKEQAKIAECYQKADLTVLPTRWDEGFSLVPIESMACATPVLATRKGGNPEIVVHQDTGYLIEECRKDDIEAMLISIPKNDLEACGARARDLVLKRHTLEAWGKAHEQMYASLVQA